MKTRVFLAAAWACLCVPICSTAAELPADKFQVENLDRGVIALRSTDTSVYIGWRLLGTDPADLAFNLYRTTGEDAPLRLNDTPLLTTTDFVDSTADPTQVNSYTVRPVLLGVELPAGGAFALAANAPVQPYLTVPLQPPPGGNVEVPAGPRPPRPSRTTANDASVGRPRRRWRIRNRAQVGSVERPRQRLGRVCRDRRSSTPTSSTARLLWRINLGRNIRAGAHYTQFIVYDLDGDGKAEVACKTADGTVDGAGTVIGDAAIVTTAR